MKPSLSETKELFLFITSKTDILNVKTGLPKGISAKHYQNVLMLPQK